MNRMVTREWSHIVGVRYALPAKMNNFRRTDIPAFPAFAGHLAAPIGFLKIQEETLIEKTGLPDTVGPYHEARAAQPVRSKTLFVALALSLHAFLTKEGRGRYLFGGTFLLLTGVSTALWVWVSDGWYWFHVFQMPSMAGWLSP